MGSEYCDDHVCLSVCVCLSANISLEIHVLSLPKILCMLPMSVAQSFSGGIAIRYVLSARGRCRISPPRFLAECCKRQLNQASYVFAVF